MIILKWRGFPVRFSGADVPLFQEVFYVHPEGIPFGHLTGVREVPGRAYSFPRCFHMPPSLIVLVRIPNFGTREIRI